MSEAGAKWLETVPAVRATVRDITSVVVAAGHRNWIFVRVDTDQPGLYGWGEATLEWHTEAVVGAIADLRALLVGEDATRVEHLWQVMYRQRFWHTAGPVTGSALSGVDMALWDILGKVHGVPLHQLWGGRVRESVRLYCHVNDGRDEVGLDTAASVEAIREAARAAVADGYSAVKSMLMPTSALLESRLVLKHVEACTAALREGAGDAVDVMVDCHARPSPRVGAQVAAVVEPFGLYFLEEPCWPEMLDDMALIQRSVSTPIATGERMITAHPFRELLEKRAASVLQPDIGHCGGLTEARRIAALAEAYRVGFAPHNPMSPVNTAASIEMGLSTPSYLVCEAIHEDVPWRDEVVQHGFEVDPATRTVGPTTRPGLGVEIDLAAAAAHPQQPDRPRRLYHRDGSVADW